VRALLLAVLALAVAAPAVAEDLEVRVFELRHKDPDDVVDLIRPALSEESSILIQSKIRTLTVTDHPRNLETVAGLIAGFDQPPRDVAVSVNLMRASRVGPGPRTGVTPGKLPPSLRELTKWLDYELLGGMSIQTTEAERSSLLLGEEYRIRFQVDLVDERSGRVRLRDFTLERRVVDPAAGETWVPIFDTVVNLKSGTPYVFGATRGQDALRALFLTITASIHS
jgi:hypothetical protein